MTFSLAPLAGFTDAPFRLMCREGGADEVYTEMVSAAALAHGHSPTHHLLETMPGESPTVCQIFGANESDVAAATREISALDAERKAHGESGFSALNLNAGCPMQKVTKCGAGAALIHEPKKIAALLRAMKENTALPVTLKTRLGPHPADTRIFEILSAAEAEGIAGLAVHARYTSQCHGGPLHLDVLAEVVRRAHVPVAGNGSVTDAKSAREMAATGVASIMIGRAALANPHIFAELKSALGTGAALEKPGDRLAGLSMMDLCSRHLAYVLSFREHLARKFPLDHVPGVDAYASVKMHTHLFRYFNGHPGAAAMRARLNSIRTLDEIQRLTATGPCSQPPVQAITSRKFA